VAGSEDREVGRTVDVRLLWDAVGRWQALVRLRRLQFERILAGGPPRDADDYWRRRARNFGEAVRRRPSHGPVVETVLAACRTGDRVLDVGGGPGSIAVPVAAAGHAVTVVEPSEAMREGLAAYVAEAGVAGRVAVVPERWEDADVDRHDVVVCAHVLYPIEDVVPFVARLRDAAGRTCLAILRLKASELSPGELFRQFHGEERIPQPDFGDLCAVLGDLGWPFEATVHRTDSSWSWATLDEAVDSIAESLLVGFRDDARRVVRTWAEQNLDEDDGRLVAADGRSSLVGIAAITI
jgi:SAM-dependent methyltransferase